MGFLRKELDKWGVIPSTQVSRLPARKKIRVAGVVICRQMPPTASGVLFITLEDEVGFINLVIWKKVYEKFKEVLVTCSFLLCEGQVEKAEDGNVTHVIVDKAWPLLEHRQKRWVESYDFR